MRGLQTANSQVFQKISAKAPVLSIVLLGVAFYYASFALDPEQAEFIRISEHALLPGVVNEKFAHERLAADYWRQLKDTKTKDARREFIRLQLAANGIDVYTHHWNESSRYERHSGSSVWGVVRAGRAVGGEAVLIGVDMHDDAVPATLALAAHAREQLLWARDVFFVFVDGGAAGMAAWLSAYHSASSAGGAAAQQRLEHYGGQMLAGVMLAAHGGKTVRVQLNGLNGQLPNLDLVNTIVTISGKGNHDLQVEMYGVPYGIKRWPYVMSLRAMHRQAFSVAEGLHSVCGQYAIQAATIGLPRYPKFSMAAQARFGEAVLRAVNNIQERFHQSYFMYIHADANRFVSIAFFMPIAGLILAPMLVFAIREWLLLDRLRATALLPVSHLSGLLVWWAAGRWFVGEADHPAVSSSLASLAPTLSLSGEAEAAAALAALLLCVPWTMAVAVPASSVRSARLLLYLDVALSLAALSLLNFSLAVVGGAVAVPAAILLTKENTSSVRAVFRTVLSLALHPLGVFLLWQYYHVDDVLMYGEAPVSLSVSTVPRLLCGLLSDQLRFGSAHLAILSCVAVPLWMQMVRLACVVDERVEMPQQRAGEEGGNDEDDKKKQ